MRRLVTLAITLLAGLSLSACSSNNSSSGSRSSSKGSNVHTVRAETQRAQYFKNNFLKLNEMTLKITDTKVIPSGNKGNEYSDKPVFAIWFTVKNTSGDKDIDPLASAILLSATQEGKDTVKTLDVAPSPDEKLNKTQTDKIKKGKTAKGSMAWELKSTKTPIVLKATSLHDTNKIGTQTYNIK